MLDGLNNPVIRTALQRVRHLEHRVGFLEMNVAIDGRESSGVVPESNKKSQRKRFQSFQEKALKDIADLGLTPHQVDVLKKYGLLAVDAVTGFQEGRSGHARFETLKDAIRHVKETGETSFYVEMDLKNLSGLNARLGHTGTNEIFAKIASLIRLFLGGAGDDSVFFRHGGDEMSLMIFNTTDVRLQVAIEKMRRAVQELAQQFHLHDLENPKHPGDSRYFGIGVHVGMAEIRPENAANPKHVFELADMKLEFSKRTPIANSLSA